MPRTVKEWIGKTADTRPPKRVLDRLYTKYNGVCQLSSIPIAGKDWEADHIIALWKGGENRESNLWPVLPAAHKKKSAKEKAEKALEDRKRKKHIGVTKPQGKLKSRGFDKVHKPKKIDKSAIAAVAPPNRGGIAGQYR